MVALHRWLFHRHTGCIIQTRKQVLERREQERKEKYAHFGSSLSVVGSSSCIPSTHAHSRPNCCSNEDEPIEPNIITLHTSAATRSLKFARSLRFGLHHTRNCRCALELFAAKDTHFTDTPDSSGCFESLRLTFWLESQQRCASIELHNNSSRLLGTVSVRVVRRRDSRLQTCR